MNCLDITVWLEEHKYRALADRLPEGVTLEKMLEETVQKLYEENVPAVERERIQEMIEQEEAEREAAEAASRRFVLIEAVKDGVTSCRMGEGHGAPLEVAYACALQYPQTKKMSSQEFLEAAFKDTEPISQEKFRERCHTDGRCIKGVYCLDFDHNTMTARIAGNSSTLPMDMVMKAAKAAYRRANLRFEERIDIFTEKLGELACPEDEESREAESKPDTAQRMQEGNQPV